ncbi:MAG: hypothetical protein A2091_09610 [Desulfuromonadales bacterium GWD2_61_12]|nr:MAG: hypothetical protein A2005_05440 [Desulfuromonadales bacterium GWC2_61_20]OGR36700.1 MAG: hypothetical protein A2091_09610 [Desulfuromonadales bacterium GWD2_61_12]
MKRKRILVVDDDHKHLQTSKEILELEGHEVIIHNSPFRTNEIVKTVRPDLLLLDVNMPGLSGERLIGLVRAHYQDRTLPIVFYSSNDEDSLRESVKTFGADGYVCKGDIAGLRRRVAQLLAAAAA